jgi:hypothetical protein
VCISLLLMGAPVSAQAATQVSIAPGEVQISDGGTAQLSVQVTDARGLYGFDLTVRYDPMTLAVVDASPDTPTLEVSPGTFLDDGTTVLNSVDHATGVIRFAMTQLNPSEAKSGSGTLIVFSVRAIRAGATGVLTVEKADLSDRDGLLISAALAGGRVVVAPAAQTTSVATSQPTPTPTPRLIAQQPAVTLLPTQTPNPTSPPPTATGIPTQTRVPAPVATATPAPAATTRPPGATAAMIHTPTTPPNQAVAAGPQPTVQPSATQAPAAQGSEITPTGNALGTGAADSTAEPAARTLAATIAPTPQPAPSATMAGTPANETGEAAIVEAVPATDTPRQSGLFNSSVETVLVLGACGAGFIILSATVLAVFILLAQRTPALRAEVDGRTPIRKT